MYYKKKDDEPKDDKPKEPKPMPYQLLSEVELAKKYFDWQFYSKQKNRGPIKSQGDLTRYLLEIGFKLQDDKHKTSIYEQEKKKKEEYAKKMNMDNLVKGL